MGVTDCCNCHEGVRKFRSSAKAASVLLIHLIFIAGGEGL